MSEQEHIANHSRTEEKTVVFLYTELAGYTMACFNHASKTGVKIHVVHWEVNKEAPFEFDADPAIVRYSRQDFNTDQLSDLIKDINPDALFISGWVDKGYMQVGKIFRRLLPVVLVLDNPWQATLRQRIGVLIARLRFQKIYSHCWVPGQRQKEYARRLGFAESNIETGFYCADLPHFNEIYRQTITNKSSDFPKRFLYVGRYLEFKGIFELWRAFRLFRKDFPEWELWCVGTGDLFDQREESEGIRHFGFLQPTALQSIISECGVFVIPSQKEPWGVVVQEFAAAGFPLICSSKVGASENFLKEGVNGFYHESASVSQILTAMKNIAEKPQHQLVQMAEESHQLAQRINLPQWTDTLKKFVNQKMYI